MLHIWRRQPHYQLGNAASRRKSTNEPVSIVKAKDMHLPKNAFAFPKSQTKKRQFSNFTVILRPKPSLQNQQYFSTGIICLSRRRQRSDFH
ncbi:hypothetical protein CDAR_395471 [Caerostris darwini]|uniref:Uncharacterized protein n=1 Tax=Caerostris darwini TaxID=1538125 RepID=A0AAV4M5Q6_9ARAC|nr:hypothetical protein CDAR_395471 [Caerostris darwini]